MDILAAVKLKLASLGYTVLEADTAVIDYAVDRAEAWLKHNLNHTEVPQGLFYAWVDMAAGMLLLDKKACGQLTGYDFDAPIKSISEGDTSVAFELGSTAETQFKAMLNKLVRPSEAALAAFRRVAW